MTKLSRSTFSASEMYMSAQVVNPASRSIVSRPRMANMARSRGMEPESSTTAFIASARPVARASSISASVASELLQALSATAAQTRVYNMIYIVVLFLTWRRQGRRRARCGGIQAVCRKNRTGCQAILTQAFPGVCCGVPLQGCRAIFPACQGRIYGMLPLCNGCQMERCGLPWAALRTIPPTLPIRCRKRERSKYRRRKGRAHGCRNIYNSSVRDRRGCNGCRTRCRRAPSRRLWRTRSKAVRWQFLRRSL